MIVLENDFRREVLQPVDDTVSVRWDGNRIVYMLASENLSINEKKIPYQKQSGADREIIQFVYRRCSYVLSFYPDHSRTYRRFAIGHSISIGSAIEDDIYLRDPAVSPSQIMIDTVSHTICDTGGIHHVFIGEKRIETGRYEQGDLLTFADVSIILMNHFIAVAVGPQVFFSLSRYDPEEDELKADGPRWIVEEKDPLPPLSLSFKIRYPAFHEGVREQGISAIGPSLTMSAAMAVLSFIAIQNSIRRGQAMTSGVTMLVFPAVMFISTLFWFLMRRLISRREKKKKCRLQEEAFAEQLDRFQKIREETLKGYEAAVHKRFLSMNELAEKWLSGKSMPVADRYDPDYLSIYLGEGKRPVVPLFQEEGRENSSRTSMEKADVLMKNMQAPVNLPLVLSLPRYRSYWLHDETGGKKFIQALFVQLCSCNRPEDLSILIIHERKMPVQLMSLAHLLGPYGIQIMCPSRYQEEKVLLHENSSKKLAVFCFEDHCSGLEEEELVFYVTDSYHSSDVIIEVNETEGIVRFVKEQVKWPFVPVLITSSVFMHVLARMAVHAEPISHSGSCSFREVNQFKDKKDILKMWQRNHGRSHLKAVLGVNEKGERIMLDLHEKGDGPHGLIAGTTGSGKSECIISILLSLAMRYSPLDLQFILIDFKGTGLLQACSEGKYILPHVAGSLSNLDSSDAERVLVSLQRECQRREKLFGKMHRYIGHDIASIDAYDQAWKPEAELPYLPHLFIVIDEFAELKKENPVFMDELVSIARIGRSLGMHMLLSTQKPSGVVNGQIASNTRYRICLKVTDKEDARDVVENDAPSLIRQPGEFYLRRDGHLIHGFAGYSGGIYQRSEESINIWDETGRKLKQKKEKGISERSYILRQLLSLPSDAMPVYSLWPARLTSIKRNEVPAGCFALLDDYYHGRYDPFVLPERLLVLSDETKESESFLLSLLFHLIQEGKDEIYLLAHQRRKA